MPGKRSCRAYAASIHEVEQNRRDPLLQLAVGALTEYVLRRKALLARIVRHWNMKILRWLPRVARKHVGMEEGIGVLRA